MAGKVTAIQVGWIVRAIVIASQFLVRTILSCIAFIQLHPHCVTGFDSHEELFRPTGLRSNGGSTDSVASYSADTHPARFVEYAGKYHAAADGFGTYQRDSIIGDSGSGPQGC